MTAEKAIGVSAFLLGIIGGLWWQGELETAEVIMYFGCGIVVGVLISLR